MSIHVITAGPAGFAGAGRIMCNGLEAVAQRGVPCTYVGPRTPFPWRSPGRRPPVTVSWRADTVTSGAIGEGAAIADPMVLLPIELADELVRVARDATASGARPLLWAHYLFPYGAAGLLAKSMLSDAGVGTDLWLNPAGSDIWEVGPQLMEVTRGLLSSRTVDRIVTYSQQFADEIVDRYRLARRVDVLKPCVKGTYRPLSPLDRAAARRRLGFADGDFLLSFHSNMRPVKAPEDVLLVSRRASAFTGRDITLVLAGPLRSVQPYCTGLTIKALGTVGNVIEILQVADLEINLSRHDSFNLSLAEAMACGVPVVSTDIVGIAPDIAAARAGELVRLEPAGHRDPRATYGEAVRTIVRFVADEAARSGAGIRAAERARQEFNESGYWQKIDRLLHDRSSTTPK